ncbi:transcriptional regulator GcvA [Nisaea sp.]|uniref:transcriptional regulator GcvA n=1 Tax=Nisaea sp. TaxID=2024842 RepID=UPI003299F069
MFRHLPPLNAVRAFEASARLKSFTAAAGELGVTHGAISRQVRNLEGWFGFALFLRSNRKVTLTPEGQEYLDEVSTVFDKLSVATERLTGPRGVTVLRICAPETFSVRWLIPRLSALARAHPNIEIRLRPMVTLDEHLTDSFDVVIRRGEMERPGFTSAPFLRETCTPVISPRLLEQMPMDRPRALRNHTLLNAESLDHLWPSWLQNAGLGERHVPRNLRFQSLNYALQAAVEGLGVAMGPSALVADDIASGRLIAPLPEHALTMGDFHILTAANTSSHDPAYIFRRWLIEEQPKE